MMKAGRRVACIVLFLGIAGDAMAANDPDDPSLAGHFSGHVTGADGKPLQHARIFVTPAESPDNGAGPVRAETDAEGRFEFDAPDLTFTEIDGLPGRREGLLIATANGHAPAWVVTWGQNEGRRSFRSHSDPIPGAEINLQLVVDDVPIHGRFLDPQGRPLAGALVQLVSLMDPPQRDLSAYLDQESKASLFNMPLMGHILHRVDVLAGLTTQTQTDANGRFTISGLGRDRLASLSITAPSIIDTSLTVMTRNKPDVGIRIGLDERPTQFIYGAGFTLQLQPGRTIAGTVRDHDTHQPIAGMWVGVGRENFLPSRTREENYPRDGILWHKTVSDGNGRFAVTGLDPSRAKWNITAVSAPGMPYQSTAIDVVDDAPVSIECRRGIPFRLKLVDEQRQPVEADVTYYEVLPNPHAPRAFCYPCNTPLSQASRSSEGMYEGFVVPGPGAVLVRTPGRSNYRPAFVDPKSFFAPGKTDWTPQELVGAYGTQNTVSIAAGWADQNDYAAIVLVNPAPDSAPLELSATIRQALPRRVSLLDPDGQPLLGAKIQGMNFGNWRPERPLRAASIVLTRLHPDRVQRITFTKEDRRLIGFLQVHGDNEAPCTVRMQPWGTITGRIIDENGNPVKAVLNSNNGTSTPSADPEVGDFHDLNTEAGGHFRIDRLVPGQRYTARIYCDHRLRGIAFKGLVVRAGEAREVGDIRVRLSPDVQSASNADAHPSRLRSLLR